jgi:hypothetical protein
MKLSIKNARPEIRLQTGLQNNVKKHNANSNKSTIVLFKNDLKITENF